MSIAALSLLAACEISTGAGEDGFGYEPKGFTVTFDSNGGTPVSPITGVQLYSTISPPEEPVTGHNFEGWFSDAGTTKQWNFTIDVVTGNITLYAKWGAYNGSLNIIGKTGPGGGKIFYQSSSGFPMADGGTCHYLEAAPADLGTFIWQSDYETNFITVTGKFIGTGRQNTAFIVAYAYTTPAATECDNYINNDKTDWFLPSEDELNELYLNRSYVGNLDTGAYWSSTGPNSSNALLQDFSDGSQYAYLKDYSHRVRPIRAF